MELNGKRTARRSRPRRAVRSETAARKLADQRAILVLGMHRSGTSALARLLGLAGATLPKQVIETAPDNAKGYWEPPHIVGIHDEMLAAVGSYWHDPGEFPMDWLSSPSAQPFNTRLRAAFREAFGTSDLALLKDPRICRFVPLWTAILESMRVAPVFVIPIRNPLETAASLMARDRMPVAASLQALGGMSEAKALLLWLRHFLEAERHTRNNARCFITYEQTLGDWRGALDRIGRELEIAWLRSPDSIAAEVEEFLSVELRHYELPIDAVSMRHDVAGWIKDAYRWALEASAGGSPDASELDRLHQALRTADATFMGIVEADHRSLAKLSDQVGRFAATLAERGAELQQRQGEAGQLREALLTQANTLNAATIRAETLDQRIVALESAIAERNHEVNELSRQAAERGSELAAARAELAEREGELTALKERLTEREASVATLDQSLLERNSQIGALLQALADLDAKVSSLQAAISALYASISWRVTALLRAAKRLLGRLRYTSVNYPLALVWRALTTRSRAPLRDRRAARIIARSGQFDREWYLRIYPDVLKSGADPVRHYVAFGAREGRDPSPAFSTRGYLSNYADVASAGVNPLAHFVLHGAAEGRESRRLPNNDTIFYDSRPSQSTRLVRNAYREIYLTQARYADGAVLPHYAPPILKPPPTERCDVKLVAYYLPQYHPIPENDEWWGKGFTEWRNVTRALPVFVGHDQPRLPGELGYYDLRVPEVMRRQVELAKLGGISAFCFHFYWFGGKQLLELPLENFLQNKDLDLKFCLCWANESWTRRWDGADEEVLIAQSYSAEDDIAFIRYLKKYFDDPRYLRLQGKPVLTVYRPGNIPDAGATVSRWRVEAERMGLPGIYLIATNSFGFSEYRKIGFDALSEFPPHGISWLRDNSVVLLHPDCERGVFSSYSGAVKAIRASTAPQGRVFPGVMPGWDNTPRQLFRGRAFHGSTPTLFYEWLMHSIARARRNEEDERVVFINAWNEWAEGAYLEPDRKTGYAYLAACAAAISDNVNDHAISRHVGHGEPIPLSVRADEEHVLRSFSTVAALMSADGDGQSKIIDGSVQKASDLYPEWTSTAGGTCRPEWWSSDPEISLSTIRIFRVRDAYYWPRFGVVATGQGVIPWSPWASASYVLSGPAGLPYVTNGEPPILSTPENVPLLEKLIVTMSWGAIHNYGHFVLDCLPGIFATRSIGLLNGYVYGFPQLTSWQRRHLELVGGLPLRELDQDLYRVSELVFTSCTNSFLRWPNLIYRSGFKAQKARVASEINPKRMIYISRKHNPKRAFISEEKLEYALASAGFSIIVPEHLSIDEQINLFGAVDVVAGCEGAAFANAVYCRPGTKVVVIQPSIPDARWVRYNCWWIRNICALMRLDWHSYFCAGVPAPNPPIHGGKERTELGMSFDIDIDDFILFLRKVM